MRTFVTAILIGVSLIGSSQSNFTVYFVDQAGSAVNDVLVLEWNGATWLSGFDGEAEIPKSELDSLSIHSVTYRDTILHVGAGDTLLLREDRVTIGEVEIYDNSNLEYLEHRHARYHFQREPGDCYLLGYFSDDDVILDSLTVHIDEVLRPTCRFRVLIWQGEEFVYESELHSVPESLIDEAYTMPIHYSHPINGEFYVGIQFLEVGRNPFGLKTHRFQYEGRGNVFTNRNTGVTLGGIRLRSGEAVVMASYFQEAVRIEKLECDEIRYRVPFMGIHYHGPGGISTDLQSSFQNRSNHETP